METTIILISGVVVLAALSTYCLYLIHKLKKQLNSQSKEIVSLKKTSTFHGMALNDLADIVSGKMYAAFPLIGQPGKA